MVVGTEDRDRARRLGEAVGVHEVEPVEQRHGPLDHRPRHRTAAVGERAHRRQPAAVGVDDVEDAVEHRRHDHGVGDRLVAHELHPLLGVEALELHDPASGVGGRQHRGHRGDVVRRHADDGGLVLARAPELERVHEVRRQVQVAEDRGLRLAGGAAGEQQHRGVVGVAAPAVGLLDRLVLARWRGSRRGRRSRSRRRPSSRSATPSPAITTAGAARVDDRPQPVVGQPVAHRHERLAGDGRSEQRDRHGERVLVDEHHALAGLRRPARCRPAAPGDRARRR